MAPILAVASLTLKESVRRRAFLVMAFFAVFLLASSAFFPALDAAGQVRLVESWGLRATLLFGILLVVFLASLSLPQDIEEKKVFMLITKPLSRPALYAGKWLGFATLLAVFMVSMGALTLGYVLLIAKKGGAEAAKALEVRERILAPAVEVCRASGAEAETSFSSDTPPRLWVRRPHQDMIAWTFRGLALTGWPAGCVKRTLRVKIRVHLTPGPEPLKVRVIPYARLKDPRELAGPLWRAVEDGGWITFDIDVRDLTADDGEMRVAVLQPPNESNREMGGSPLDATALLINAYEGGIEEVEYTYHAFSTMVGGGYANIVAVPEVEALHNPKTDRYTIHYHRSPPFLARWVFRALDAGNFDRNASIEVRLPVKGPMFRKYGFVVVSVRSQDGQELDRRKLRVATNSPASFPLSPSWVSQGQSLAVEVERGEADTVFAVIPDGVVLRSRNVSFVSGFVRALALTYLELLLLLAIVLPCSTWLSGPVSLFVGIALFICGMALESIQENLVHLESVIRTTEVMESTRGEDAHHHGGVEVPLWALRASRFLLKKVVLATFPELHRFEGAPLLISGVLIPGSHVGETALYVGAYTLISSLLGMLIMRFREFR